MTDVYGRLSATDRERVLFVAFGRSARSESSFCQESFPAAGADSLWADWGIAQRDMVLLRRTSQNAWTVYCKFSMNSYTSDFESVVRGLLDTIASESGSVGSSTTSAATAAPQSNSSTAANTSSAADVISTTDSMQKTPPASSSRAVAASCATTVGALVFSVFCW
eukprot:TRINITY_DN50787_c0_g1_i1.p1 TRINITY_DN50787_c0_g1~~TRINITY_DN50787_c0_g1_i1.p1  ORF type:complete len:165 (-),score=22.55 TRINITY_DN50787_c0_g1_i1:12-506(-)